MSVSEGKLPGNLTGVYFCLVTHLFRAIVYVVDSAIFQKEVRDVAEFLYILLTDPVISRNAPALLVACNKQGEKAFQNNIH